jgi:chromosome segregation ATPase
MQADEIKKRLKWLDEKRREDTETIDKLKKQLNGYEKAAKKQEAQIKELVGQVTRLAAEALRTDDLDGLMAKQRGEITRQLSVSDGRGYREKKEVQARDRRDQQLLGRMISELREGQSAVGKVMDRLDARQEEEKRITRKLDAMEKRVDEVLSKGELRDQEMGSIEEAYTKDRQRLSEVQSGTTELGDALGELRHTVTEVADRLRRAEASVQVVQGESKILSENEEAWREKLQMERVAFEREWTERGKRFEGIEKRAIEIEERMLEFDETYRKLQQLQNQVEMALERLQRRINEVSEMYRLAEDRLKQEWTTFQAGNQKRWSTHKLTYDDRWREHTRLHEQMASEMQTAVDNLEDLLAGFSELRGTNRQHLLGLLGFLQSWAAELDSGAGSKK